MTVEILKDEPVAASLPTAEIPDEIDFDLVQCSAIFDEAFSDIGYVPSHENDLEHKLYMHDQDELDDMPTADESSEAYINRIREFVHSDIEDVKVELNDKNFDVVDEQD